MAAGARRLPKWQPLANLVPNAFVANGVPKENLFFVDFFYLLFKYDRVKYRYKK